MGPASTRPCWQRILWGLRERPGAAGGVQQPIGNFLGTLFIYSFLVFQNLPKNNGGAGGG